MTKALKIVLILAAGDPLKHRTWIQAGIISYGLSLISTLYYLLILSSEQSHQLRLGKDSGDHPGRFSCRVRHLLSQEEGGVIVSPFSGSSTSWNRYPFLFLGKDHRTLRRGSAGDRCERSGTSPRRDIQRRSIPRRFRRSALCRNGRRWSLLRCAFVPAPPLNVF